jgi:HEAT repeat protein
LSAAGDLRGDGSYHEERSSAAEKVWQQPSDPGLLRGTAITLAKIGAPSGINLLLNSALDDSPANSDRRSAALLGLEQVYSRNATVPVAALLALQKGANERSILAAKILVNIGDEEAAKALVEWFENTDDSAVELAINSVMRTRTPTLIAAWNASLEPNQTFRSEAVHMAIREALERYHKRVSIEE